MLEILQVTLGPRQQPEQRVAHASPAANATWRQRYLISEAHWGGPGSPILFYTGNEGPITGFWAACGFVTEVLAPRLGALVVFAEQRFYGESLPFGRIGSFSPAALALLTAEQVLADYALLLTSLKAQLHAADIWLNAVAPTLLVRPHCAPTVLLVRPHCECVT